MRRRHLDIARPALSSLRGPFCALLKPLLPWLYGTSQSPRQRSLLRVHPDFACSGGEPRKLAKQFGGSFDHDRNRQESAKPSAPAAHSLVGKPIARKARQEPPDGDPPLQPRNVEASTHMGARAEGQVA